MGFFFYEDVFAATLNKPSNQLGLVGHWTFDGGKMLQDVGDSSGYGHNGILESFTATTSVLGPLGQALLFDGSDDVVRVKSSSGGGHALDFTNGPFTISTWFNCAASSGSILAKRSSDTSIQYQLQLDGGYVSFVGGPVGGDIYGEAGRGSTAVSCGTWYHAVVVVDASNNPEIYLNGAQETWVDQAGTRPFTFPHENVDVSLGARYHTGPATYFNYNGKLDDIRIYNRALSLGEIKGLYNSNRTKVSSSGSPTGLQSSLTGHWTFDGKDMVPNVRDLSGQGKHANITGQTSTTSVPGKIGQALSVDADDDVKVSSVVMTQLDNVTLSIWAYWLDTSGLQVILYNGNTGANGYGLIIDGSACGTGNKLDILIGGISCNVLNSTYQMPTREWTHIVAVRNAGTWRLYANGVDTGLSAVTTPTTPTTETILSSDFHGYLDDARTYSRALSANEIKQLYAMGGSKLNSTQNTSRGSLSSGLVGHWTFDGADMNPNVRDKSGQGKHGNLFGQTATTTAIGKLGQALKFDGVNDYVNASTFSWLGGPVTVSFWNYVASTPGDGASAFGADTNDTIRFQAHVPWSDGSVYWDYGDLSGSGRISTSYAAHIGKWTYVTLVSAGNGGNYKAIYFDGVLAASEASSDSPTSFSNMLIGAFNNNASSIVYYHPGTIDDFRIYNRVLSESEIKQLYNLAR